MKHVLTLVYSSFKYLNIYLLFSKEPFWLFKFFWLFLRSIIEIIRNPKIQWIKIAQKVVSKNFFFFKLVIDIYLCKENDFKRLLGLYNKYSHQRYIIKNIQGFRAQLFYKTQQGESERGRREVCEFPSLVTVPMGSSINQCSFSNFLTPPPNHVYFFGEVSLKFSDYYR